MTEQNNAPAHHDALSHRQNVMTQKEEIVVGVDIGGTNTAIGFIDGNGHCLAQSSFPTNAHRDAGDFVARLHESIEVTREKNVGNIVLRGIGIGAPNGNYCRGTVDKAPNLPGWKGIVDLVSLMSQHYDVPIVLTNDANAAALGEMKFGSAMGMKDFVVITLGTGLGSGIVVNGEVVYGSTGFAGEVGHTIVDPDGRDCGCGRKGCLETYASAPGLVRTVLELLSKRKHDSLLRTVPANACTAKMIAEAAAQGDVIAREAFEYTGRILALKLADTIAHTSPEAIFLFGGLAAAGELIFEPTRRYLDYYVLNIFKGTVRLLPSGLSESNAAVLGASALVWNRR